VRDQPKKFVEGGILAGARAVPSLGEKQNKPCGQKEKAMQLPRTSAWEESVVSWDNPIVCGGKVEES